MKTIYRTFVGGHFGPSWAALVLLLLSVNLRVAHAGAEVLVGNYVGAWTNLTFNSTGKALVNIQVTGTNATIHFQMDGPVFGMPSAPPIDMPATVSGNVLQINNHGAGIFGDIVGTVNAADGSFAVTLTNIPGNFIERVTASGTILNGAMNLKYTVFFPGASSSTNPANGVLNAVAALTITQAQRQGDQLRITWTGGKPPFQVQTRTSLTAGAWLNQGSPTNSASAQVSIVRIRTLFVRVLSQ